MNALVEPGRSDASDPLALAQRLVERGALNEAADVLAHALDGAALTERRRADLQFNLAVALSMLARLNPSAAGSAEQLLRARVLLAEAIRFAAPGSPRWAAIRTNQALLHVAAWTATGEGRELLEAHLALDGTEAVFELHGDTASLDWARAVRDHLVELRERRSSPRPLR